MQGWGCSALDFACAAAALNCMAVGPGGIQPVEKIEELVGRGRDMQRRSEFEDIGESRKLRSGLQVSHSQIRRF